MDSNSFSTGASSPIILRKIILPINRQGLALLAALPGRAHTRAAPRRHDQDLDPLSAFVLLATAKRAGSRAARAKRSPGSTGETPAVRKRERSPVPTTSAQPSSVTSTLQPEAPDLLPLLFTPDSPASPLPYAALMEVTDSCLSAPESDSDQDDDTTSEMTATCALNHHRLIANSRAETNKLMQWYTSQSKTIGHECDPIVRRSRLEKLDQQMAEYRRMQECFHRTASQQAAQLMRATAARLSPMPPLPLGTFLVPIASTMCEPTKHCTILGALGRMNCVPWDGNQSAAIDLAATILAAQIQPHLRTNPRRHIGHVVLAMPHQSGAFPFVWDSASAMLASRHALHSLGANPNRHDAMVIHHRQRVALGADHNEEALHLVYSRVRDDGWFLQNPHANVSLHLGLARFDHAAGLGARLGIARPSSMPVYWGYRHVQEGTLTASLASPRGGESDESISLLSQDFLEQVAQEGVPTRGSCGGIWLQKQTLRDHEEIHSLLTYLMGRQ